MPVYISQSIDTVMLGVVVHTCNPSTLEIGAGGSCEFQTILFYMESFSPANTVHSETLTQRKKRKEKKKNQQ